MSDFDPINQITEALSQVLSENDGLRESLSDVKMMLDAENRGWSSIGAFLSGENLEGFDLDELQEVSQKLRTYTTGNALMRRGCQLHIGYVFSNGFFVEGTEAPTKGRPSDLRNAFVNRVNQENIFSYAAQSELQRSRYTDGMVFLAAHRGKKEVRRIPLSEITGVKVDEDYGEDVIAYRRTWKQHNENKTQSRWYMTDRFSGVKPKSYADGAGELVPVDQDVVIVDGRFNRAVGFVLGVPDAIAASVYVTAYDQILQYGRIVDESLSRILYKVVNKTKQGVQTTGVKIANSTVHGGTASMAEGQDLQALGGTRVNFNFSNARPVAAMAAAALDVSNIDLLADSSAAGSSYGAGNLLTVGVRNAMKQKQNEWTDIFHRVFHVLGLGRPRIFFEKMEDVEPYRAAQALTLLSPTLSDEEYRMKALDTLDIIGNATDIPESLKLRNISPNAASQQAAPDQGQSNGTGGGGQGANDQRSDGIGENMRHEMAMEDQLTRMSEMLARFEELTER